VVQLFEAAQGAGSLLFAVIGIVYFSLIAVVAITAVFASKPTHRKAALEVLRVLWIRRGTSSRVDRGGGGKP
jgi:hypothetical protein